MYFPLSCHTHYSLLEGLNKPNQIADRIEKLGLQGCAMTDISSLAGSVNFVKAMNQRNLKPILGCKIFVSGEQGDSTLTLIAKNLQGWKSLIKITSESNTPENFNKKPKLTLEQISELNDGNIIAMSGHIGSELSKIIFDYDFLNDEAPFHTESYEEAKCYIDKDWLQNTVDLVEQYKNVFGEDNFFIEIQLQDQIKKPSQRVVAEGLRYVAKKTGISPLAINDSRYCEKSDADDHRVLICNLLRTTLPEIKSKISNLNSKKSIHTSFFKSNSYHIPSIDDMQSFHTEEELANTIKVSEMCESYNILREPILPEFQCPNNEDVDEYLRSLCRKGWAEKIKGIIPEEKQGRYVDRVNSELEVLQNAGLSSYFLIVADIIDNIRSSGWLPGPGRGSAAGCLVSYLIGITSIDPIKYELIFERFYNAGRNTGGRVSMPDIDIDVPVSKRDEIIDYIKEKYGVSQVAQMITFQTMMGRSAMKDVLRTYGDISFEEMNRITENIPDKADIAEDLQEMMQETGESSIIRWSLENKPEKFRDWCYIDDDGSLQGRLAKRFEQAIRLEGTKRTQSKHAAGVIISPQPMSEICPMILDSTTKKLVAGLEMQDMEDIGMIKFDVLGVAMLDKIMGVQSILKEGEIND
jgi:DNA polymerase-3 subunit alpha